MNTLHSPNSNRDDLSSDGAARRGPSSRSVFWMAFAGLTGLAFGLALAHLPAKQFELQTPPSVDGATDANSRVVGQVRASEPQFTQPATADDPYLLVLGVVQDAGFPQAGCYEPHCMPGWQTPGGQRGAVSLGLITKNQKFLFEATPDLPAQLYQLEQSAPERAHPLAGIFITHAHIGHYAGLMFLGHEAMGASNVPVYAMPRMSAFLKANGPWSQLVAFGNIELRALTSGQSVLIDGVTVTPFEVPHRDEFSETVGYVIAGKNTSAVFIPDINKWADWDQDLKRVVASHDYALIDGAFYADGELPGRDMSKIPHPFVSESMQLLSTLDRRQRSKVWFIHMNHTNPLLIEGSAESQHVIAEGYNVAREGVRLSLP